MFFLSQSEKNGFQLLKRTYSFFTHFPQGLLYGTLTVLINFSIFCCVLYGEYTYYGIHIFDATTLTTLLELNLWEHIWHIIIILMIMTLSAFITFYLRISLTYAIGEKLQGRAFTFFKSLIVPQKRMLIVFHAGIITVLNLFINFLHIIFIAEKLLNFLQILEGEKPKKVSRINQDRSLLLLPLIIEEKHSIAHSLSLSEHLVEKNFGQKATLNISFYFMLFIFFTPIIFMLGKAMFLHTLFLQASIISGILFFIFLTILNQALTFFSVCTYFYCKQIATEPFTKEEISTYFKKVIIHAEK